LPINPSRLIRVGRVAGAFGVKGEVRITAFTEKPANLLAFGELLREDGSPGLKLVSGRPHKDSVVARIAGIDDKDAADALRGLQLYAPRERFPDPAEDEFYLTDLIGLAVRSPDGKPLGQVKAVDDFGAGDVLEIAPPTGASWQVAFTRANVPEVNIARGEIVVDRPPEVSEHES
jgi:16S rRNA processing protein RimM